MLVRIASLMVLALNGCAKRPADEAKPPVEAAPVAPRGPELRAAAPPDASVNEAQPVARNCRGHRLPIDQHYAAEGLCVGAVATKQGKLRDIEFLPNGDLIGVRANGEIVRYRDSNQNGWFEPDTGEVVVWAEIGGNGHGCHFADGYLYCGSKPGIKRFRYSAEAGKGGPGEDVVLGMPTGGNHPIHSVKVYDGVLYAVSASEENSLDPMPRDYDKNRSVLKRFRLADFAPGKPFAWKNGELLVTGIRNATALARGPKHKLYGGINNLDDVHYAGVDVHDDNPGETVVLLEKGKRYGWPFCFHAARIVRDGKVVPPGTPLHADVKKGALGGLLKSNKDDAWCADNVDYPVTFLQAHSSVLDLEFVPEKAAALPARYKGGAFVSLHGSWNRRESTGHKVVWLPFDAEGNAPMPTSTATETRYPYEVVFGGGTRGAHKDGEWSWKTDDADEGLVRPVGLAISPVDGALYVSSDNAPVGAALPIGKNDGAIYRIAVER